jgi:hypothetical protein
MKSDGKEGVQKCRKISAKVIQWDTVVLRSIRKAVCKRT